jgi:O-acetyl-ADP-ribose deacetylase (regulator of RNase III)/uncharacterized protein YwgA
MIKVLIGNLFETSMQTLVNTVNCVGVMGKGVAKTFKENYPSMFDDYKQRCEHKHVKPGVPYFYKDMLGVSILNFPTKDHWRSPSKLSDVINGLDVFVENYKTWKITSIAFPPLGCGNGGLSWEDVGPLMYQRLKNLDIDIEIYAPFGTPTSQLKLEFLDKNLKTSMSDKGKKLKAFNPEWLTLIEVLNQLEQQPYANPIGRTIFQKICYIMTELGTDTGFKFSQSSYGPFSSEIKDALHYFSNSNLIHEEQLGQMTAIKVDKSYKEYFEKYSEVINSKQKLIFKTVDLFSRIKNTDQAEEITTVLFASRRVKEKDGTATEQQLFDYILDWKKSWDKEEKKKSVSSTIQNLEMLSWLKLNHNESLREQTH